MKDDFKQNILSMMQADEIFHIEDIQSLWSGYGKIVRYGLKGCDLNTLVVKQVELPDQNNHPRGWNTDRSHQRKIKSYQVESNWYRYWSQRCDGQCRVPRYFPNTCDSSKQPYDNAFLMVLEDLDASGFSIRKTSVCLDEMKWCLKWLANFHATFLTEESGYSPKGLWANGTYWHLETRPDELSALKDSALKAVAPQIDQLLRECRFQTIIHGDAKLANFCFSDHSANVAAVDFQYVGGGCGMKDVIYFIGSCLNEYDCERHETELLDNYFSYLSNALLFRKKPVNPTAVEREWRSLYEFAWTDFHRFLKGWSPGHWKINDYSERIAAKVIAKLNHSVETN